MEVYGTERSERVKQRWDGEFWAVHFVLLELFPRETLSVHVRKTFPAALISPPHTTSHLSSASPVRMFLIGYKNQNSRCFLLPFLLPYSFALKNMLLVFFFLNPLFLILDVFFGGSRTGLHLWLHVLGIHYVQVFGLNDMRKHVVPKHRAERIYVSRSLLDQQWERKHKKKSAYYQNVSAYQTWLISSFSAGKQRHRAGWCTSMWVCITALQTVGKRCKSTGKSDFAL